MINMPRADMLTVVRKLGLSSGLKLCLDAGHEASYSSGQPWLDLSGNGYDFNRGSGSGSDAADPTFNGTAGRRSDGEYWSFDGGDYFTYDSANETWMNNLHKDNAKFSVCAWVYGTGSDVNHSILGTNGNVNTNIGVFLRAATSTGTLAYQVLTGGGPGTAALNITSTLTGFTAGRWNFVALSIDEAAGSGLFFINGGVETFTSTYTSPSASNATYAMQIGSRGNANTPVTSGARMASALMWEGAALDVGQLRALFQATRGKFGV